MSKKRDQIHLAQLVKAWRRRKQLEHDIKQGRRLSPERRRQLRAKYGLPERV